MIWDSILGHAPQAEMFRRAMQRGRLAHAYMLIGPAGIGKRLFAQTVAQCLFCERFDDDALDACGACAACRQMQAGTHPDLLAIGLPEGKKELPISLIAGDRDHRARSGLCYDLSLAPMSASRRVAIIDDADAMNEEAANALLKTLEEPPVGSLVFLIASDTERLLPTIRSRCQPIRFSALTDSQVSQLLADGGSNLQSLQEVLPMAEGSVHVAAKLTEPGLHALWKTVEAALRQRPIAATQSVQKITAALEELGTDTASQRENMRWAVRFCIESLRKDLGQTDDLDELDRTASLLDRCFEAELHLNQTMPVPLCLDALFSELARRSREPAL